MNQGAYKMLMDGISMIQKPRKKQIATTKPNTIVINNDYNKDLPIQINIVLQNEVMAL